MNPVFINALCVLYVQVTLCANTVRTYRLALVVDVEGVGEEVRSLPIDAKSETFTHIVVHANSLYLSVSV